MHFTCETLTYCILSDFEDEHLADLIDCFSCGNPSIDRYLQKEAYYDHYEFEANTSLVFCNSELVGYFTLKQDVVKSKDKENERRCLVIARLGVKKDYQCNGLGTSILQFIGALAEMFNQRYITIDSVWEYREFYYKRGFEPFSQAEYEEPNEFGLVYMFMDLYDEEKVDKLYNSP